MAKIVTSNLKTHMARQFVESFDESSNTLYYTFAARPLPWTDDTSPDAANASIQEYHYNVWDEMVFGKKVANTDVKHMIARNDWTAGTVYDTYDPTDASLSTKDFFVVSQEGADYYVFKCLNNNNGAQANDQPLFSETSAEDEFYQTNDGYQWKYMYKITEANFDKFATADYVPVITDSNVTANAINGSIESIKVTTAGTSYNSYANGNVKEAAVAGNTLLFGLQSTSVTLSANTDFYKNSTIYIRSGTGAGQARTIGEYIVTGDERRVLLTSAFSTLPDTTSVFEIGPRIIINGDGSGAVAVATVNSSANSIANVEIISKGSGYSYANVTITGNTGTLVAANTAVGVALISPPGGHGSNVINELFADKVCISTTFANTESNTIPIANDYRRVGLLKDPKFANVELTLTTSTASSFTDGEEVIHYVAQSSNTLLKTFTYRLSRYQTATLADDAGFAVGDSVSTTTGKSGVIIAANTSANTINILKDSSSAALSNTDVISDGTITKRILSVSNNNPLVVVTRTPHGLANAIPIVFSDIPEATGINDTPGATYYPLVTNTTAFELYTDAALSSAVDGEANTAGTDGYLTNGNRITTVDAIEYTHTGNNDPIFGKDDASQKFGMGPNVSQSTDLPVELVVELNGTVVSSNHHVTTSNSYFTAINQTLDPASDVVVAKVYTTVETMLTADYIGRTTGEVSNRAGSILRLRNIKGNFSTGQTIKGLTSGTTAVISSIDRSFNTFNQLTEFSVQITSTGSIGGIVGTGFAEDDFVSQSTTSSSGYMFGLANTITRYITSVTAANPAVVTTSIAHNFSNGDFITFKNLNGTALDDDAAPTTYFVQTVNTTAFQVYTDSGLSTTFNNSSNTAANTGIVINSGGYAGTLNSNKTFYLNNVRGTFSVSDDATGTINSFTTANGAEAKINSRIDPDLVDGEGEVLYIENIQPVTRATDQSEKIKLIFEF